MSTVQQRVACLWTNVEVSKRHVGEMGEAYCKGRSVTLLWWLPNVRPNVPYFFLPQIPCPCSWHIFSTFSFLYLFNFFNISFLSLGHGQNEQKGNLLCIHKINPSDPLAHWLPCSKIFPSSYYYAQNFHISITSNLKVSPIVIVFSFDAL